MMKKWLISLLAVSLITWSPVLAAGEHDRLVDELVRDILAEQEVSEQEQIDCARVSEEQFDKLGDALMGAMVGNDEQHEVMDNMMGGERSESLQAMHVGMGQRYLGCSASMGTTPLRQSSMGQMGGMMGMMGGLGNMMGLGEGGMLVFWVLVVVVIGLFIAWLNRQQNSADSTTTTALNILKERYAKGEIDKQEFNTKKKDLIL